MMRFKRGGSGYVYDRALLESSGIRANHSLREDLS